MKNLIATLFLSFGLLGIANNGNGETTQKSKTEVQEQSTRFQCYEIKVNFVTNTTPKQYSAITLEYMFGSESQAVARKNEIIQNLPNPIILGLNGNYESTVIAVSNVKCQTEVSN